MLNIWMTPTAKFAFSENMASQEFRLFQHNRHSSSINWRCAHFRSASKSEHSLLPWQFVEQSSFSYATIRNVHIRDTKGAEIKTTVGFIGLGAMGYGMARNLVLKGHDVLAFDLNSKPLQRLVQQRGRLSVIK